MLSASVNLAEVGLLPATLFARPSARASTQVLRKSFARHISRITLSLKRSTSWIRNSSLPGHARPDSADPAGHALDSAFPLPARGFVQPTGLKGILCTYV